jgi:hypothetical protein
MHMCAVERCIRPVMHEVSTSTVRWMVLVCSFHLNKVVRLVQLRYKGTVEITALLPEWCTTRILHECDRIIAYGQRTAAG